MNFKIFAIKIGGQFAPVLGGQFTRYLHAEVNFDCVKTKMKAITRNLQLKFQNAFLVEVEFEFSIIFFI